MKQISLILLVHTMYDKNELAILFIIDGCALR